MCHFQSNAAHRNASSSSHMCVCMYIYIQFDRRHIVKYIDETRSNNRYVRKLCKLDLRSIHDYLWAYTRPQHTPTNAGRRSLSCANENGVNLLFVLLELLRFVTYFSDIVYNYFVPSTSFCDSWRISFRSALIYDRLGFFKVTTIFYLSNYYIFPPSKCRESSALFALNIINFVRNSSRRYLMLRNIFNWVVADRLA